MKAWPMHPRFRVLFLGTRNSERSIVAEFLLRSMGGDSFEVYSAGEIPTGEIHPLVLQILREDFEIDTAGAVANSWQDFADQDFDFVITLSDDARERSRLFRAPRCAPTGASMIPWRSKARARRSTSIFCRRPFRSSAALSCSPACP